MSKESQPLFQFSDIDVVYTLNKKRFFAVQNISLQGFVGKTLGIVGESGCGKSTLAKTLLAIQKPSKGAIFFNGHNLHALSQKELRNIRKEMQPVFQDPDAALNPRMTISDQLKEGMRAHKIFPSCEFDERVTHLLEMVQLPADFAQRYPFQLSGGQKQRICIARALSVQPKLIVCDEPLSSLDVSVRLQIVALLQKLQQEYNIAYLFITHDLTTLKLLAHSIAVLYLGELVEFADTFSLYTNPLHPYTQALLSAIPIPDPKKERSRSRIVLNGDIPSPLNPPSGCPFHTRCPRKMAICEKQKPQLKEVNGQLVACHLYSSP